MKNDCSVEELLQLIVESGEFNFEKDADISGCLTIKLQGLTSLEAQNYVNAFKEYERAGAQIDSKKCNVYDDLIPLIKSYRLYKPRNPHLAILQVAKDNGILLEDLKQAFAQSLQAR